MPYFAREPRVIGRSVVFALDISPMRTRESRKGSLPDQVGGTVMVSRKGVSMLSPGDVSTGAAAKKLIVRTQLPTRVIRKAGVQRYEVSLPKAVARELRAIKPQRLAHRLRVVVWNDKDINPGVPGYDRKQVTASFMPPAFASYLKSRRDRAASRTRMLPSKTSTDTFLTTVIYNGSPFDLSVNMNYVQCMTPYLTTWNVPWSMGSNTSFEFNQVNEVSGNTFYDEDSSRVQASATSGMDSLKADASQNVAKASFLKQITGSASKSLLYFGVSMATSLVGQGVEGAIVDNNACTDSGSAMNFSWTNADVSATQTTGNVSYWVPGYSRTAGIGSPAVKPTSIPTVAQGSPLTAYQATSANGLAVTPATLENEIGLGGTVTLTTLNSSGDCDYRNQQSGNPNSSSSTSQYGSSAFSGGTSADWGACYQTDVTGSDDYLQDWFGDSNSGQLRNQGYTFLIGYSSTSLATAGPAPALPPTSAVSAAACVGTSAPCIYTAPAAGANPNLTVGCTVGDWNLLTPWNASSPSMSLSNPPSVYSSASYLSTQIGFKGVTASGDQILDLIPASDGGNVTSSFNADADNPFSLSPSDLTAIQTSLGGPEGVVTDWLCVLTANTMVPSGISSLAPAAVAMNLGWSGVPIFASTPNPAGNLLSPS